MLSRLLSCLFLFALLAGCSEPPTVPAPETPAAPETTVDDNAEVELPTDSTVDDVHAPLTYRCDDGTRFELVIDGANAVMTLEGEEHELRQQPAASGVFHVGAVWQLHGKGDQALLIGADGTRECELFAASGTSRRE